MMHGNERKWEMLHNGEVEYFFDGNGDLWKGPLCPNDNLHYAIFGGFTDCGQMIWTCQRSDPPETKLTTKQFEEFLYRQLMERYRVAAAKEVKQLASRL